MTHFISLWSYIEGKKERRKIGGSCQTPAALLAEEIVI
jgi:hypothetical protein